MNKRIAPFLLAALLCLSAWSTHAQAGTITVTTTADTGAGSLRAAVDSANTNAGSDTILFSSLFNSAQTISLDTALPTFTSDVVVTGPGAKLLNIKATTANSYFIFTVNSGVNSIFSGLTISNSSLAIYNLGSSTLTLTDCAISGNGTGIYHTGNDANATITGSTFSGNGAGFVFVGGSGTVGITNSTFNNNSQYAVLVNAGGQGFIQAITLTNCTVSGNAVGLYQATNTTPITIRNTIVAGNTSSNVGTPIDGGNNITTGNPMLGSLQDNGGQTQTMALLEGSPAINAGNDALAPATDQRGISRPQRGQSDIGAFEAEPAQSLIVTTPLDEDDGTSNPGTGTGTSLREAIIFANSNPDVSTITFDSPGPAPFTVNLTSALPVLSTPINIHNELTKAITVKRSAADGTPNFRIFKISNGTTTGPTVDITNLTISNGNGGTDEFGLGGGILNENGTLSLTGCVISGNSAPDFSVGGGIFNSAFEGAASLTVTNCTFTGNSSSGTNGRGGAIASIAVNGGMGTVTVTGSTFSGNSAADNGGGILNLVANGGTGTLNVTDSTFSGNSATNNGGGIYNGKGTLTLSGSTLSGNSANNGGGVYNDAQGNNAETDTATTTVTNSTFSGNTATEYGGGIYHNGQNGTATLDVNNATFFGNSATTGGGGIFNNGAFGSATLNINNSILKKGASGANILNIADIGTINSGGYNLSDDEAGGNNTTAPGGFLNGTGDKRNTNPQFGALQDNGGPTFTHLPADNSPAVSSGNTSLTVDQRGVLRPQGTADDIGAVEIVGVAGPSNAAPVLSDIAITPTEDTTFTFTAQTFKAGFADANSDTLQTVKIVSLPTHGVLKLSNVAVTAGQEIAVNQLGNLTYLPALNYSSTDTFNWNASDGKEYSGTNAAVNITVTAVNDAPTLSAIPAINGNSGEKITFFAYGEDVDSGAVLEYSLIGAPVGASINSATGEFSWTPSGSQAAGPYNFQVKVKDGQGGEATRPVTINVTKVNTAPVLPAVGNRTVYYGRTTTFDFAATDSDLPKNTLTYSLIGAPAGATINSSTGVFTWTPTSAQVNNGYSFKVRVVDNGTPALSDEETAYFTVQYPVEITVDNVNPSLKADGKSQSVTLVYTVRNNTNATISNLKVIGDVFWPATLQNVELSATSGTTAIGSVLSASSKRVIWSIPSIPAYGTKTLSVKLTGVVPMNAPQRSRIAIGFALSPVSSNSFPNYTTPEVFLNTYK